MIIYSKILFKNYVGITLFPFIVLRSSVKKTNKLKKKIIVNHERIHLAQQREMFVLPFYMVYLANYLINLVRYRNHDKAYRNIVFEREAYANERNLKYLKNRKRFAWIRRA